MDPAETEITHDYYTIKGILAKERNQGIYLPHFQRNFVWHKEAQKNLIASLLAGCPIGTLLIFAGKRSDYAHRTLGHKLWYSPSQSVDNTRVLYLLDGQQRLSGIKWICSDPLSEENVRVLAKKMENEKDITISDWKDVARATDGKLRNRWHINLTKFSEDLSDVFGCGKLEFPKEAFMPSDYLGYIFSESILLNKPGDFTPEKNLESIREKAIEKKILPLWLLLGEEDEDDTFNRIIYGIAEDFKSRIEMETGKELDSYFVGEWNRELKNFLEKRLCDTIIPAITLQRENSASLGIAVFEATNRGGTRLNNFDLIAARMANKDKTSLSIHIECVLKEDDKLLNSNYDMWDNSSGIPSASFQNAFLDCLGLETYIQKHGLNKDQYPRDITKEGWLLGLDAMQIKTAWLPTVNNLIKIFRFLHNKCGIMKLGDIQYRLMILPLYLLFREIGDADHEKMEAKAEYWYWSALFSGRYREAQNARALEDCITLYDFSFNGDSNNPFADLENVLFEDAGYSDFKNLGRYSESKNFNKSLDKVILQFLISGIGLADLTDRAEEERRINTKTVARGDFTIDAHHLYFFSGDSNDKKDADSSINSPLNKTYISSKANRDIGNDVTKYHTRLGWKSTSHALPQNFKDEARVFMEKKGDNDPLLEKFLKERHEKLKEKLKERLSILKGSM